MRIRSSYLVVPLLGLAVSFGTLGACSNQGEGQVCDPNADNSGNSDCQDGLVCTSIGSQHRCCPSDRSQSAPGNICLPSLTGVAANPAPVDGGSAEAGPVSTAGFDAAEASSEAHSALDAPAEASSDVAMAPTSEGSADGADGPTE
jgi:hypothetical protein